MARDDDWREPHPNASRAGAPGASAPGEKGYDGEVGVGDEGAEARPESFQDPFGRPAQRVELEDEAEGSPT